MATAGHGYALSHRTGHIKCYVDSAYIQKTIKINIVQLIYASFKLQ